MLQRRQFLQAMGGASALGLAPHIHAQSQAPIKVLCGFATGGLTDVVARLFADKLRVELQQSVVVDNRVGAGGRLAAQALTSASDGKTYMIAPNSLPVFHEILYPRKTLGYDMLNDWRPVGTLTTYPFGMVVLKKFGLRNVMDYIQWVKANPDQAMYGCGGAGGQGHFAGTQLAMAAKLKLTAVPYKGNGPVSIDLMGEQIPAAILPASDLMQHRNNPKLQILGLFEDERSPLVPEMPTFAEQGLPFNVGRAWMGMWAAGKTPEEEVQRIAAALQKILADESFKDQLMSRFTMYPLYKTPKETDELQRYDLNVWRPVIEQSGFRPEA